MTDESNQTGQSSQGDGASAAQQRAQPPLTINAQYIKDLSFEAPATPGVFSQIQKNQPDITVNVDVQATTLEAPVYEVVLNVRADCKAGNASAFLLELSYAGVFTLNVPENDIRPVLLIECPRLLFPFARQIISSTTLSGGFLPLMLGPIDFASLYQRQVQEAPPAASPS